MRERVVSLVLLIPAVAWAVDVLPRSIAERARLSQRVALVQVIERRSEPQGRSLKTYTRVVVGEDLKGSGPSEVTIVQLGGRLGEWEAHVAGDATFEVGETAVVFLRCREPRRCTLVGLGEGKLAIDRTGAAYRDLEEVLAELRVAR